MTSVPWFITLPNTLIPRGVVEQFQRRFLNWCWHWVRQWHALKKNGPNTLMIMTAYHETAGDACKSWPGDYVLSNCTSSMTISAALRTDSMTSPRALQTPTCPGVRPLSRAHGAAPDTGLERGSLARELRQKTCEFNCYSLHNWGGKEKGRCIIK